MSEYIHPKFKGKAFHCPHCGAYAHQLWFTAHYEERGIFELPIIQFAFCTHCDKLSIWYDKNMVYPAVSNAPLPNKDLPEEIRDDYLEARSILNQSPRGSAALLRLVIQKICIHLGEKGNINADISNLVKKGLPKEIQQSLDFVRVVGNNAVHPGKMDIKDNREIAVNLFELVNFIADRMITQPKRIQNLYNSLPISQTESISKRDGGIDKKDNDN
ncbi:protein of unknown function [Cyclobacterium xiamenense]|uniref:DUF4145 domain-containing protein n=1 Tax=Cyclobacterium xiamenense TaxID=1297121 RepID=A0A1H6WPM4_9BACT|nr:DUF4145 domain-containing protein [Cyclobacterium xiamenense]SEJ16147.1 protein of unknown function [Cyclobacterium xiamenense]